MLLFSLQGAGCGNTWNKIKYTPLYFQLSFFVLSDVEIKLQDVLEIEGG